MRQQYPAEISGFRFQDLNSSRILLQSDGAEAATWQLTACIGDEAFQFSPLGTHFIYNAKGLSSIMCDHGAFHLGQGMYAAVPGYCRWRGQGIVISVPEYRGFFHIGGPIEKTGRLKYIDGCTDSLLIPPPKKGDPCLNHLHFPGRVNQTMHTHPTVRIGIVARGRGICRTPTGPVNLEPGLMWVLHAHGQHGFTTGEEPMDVIVWHPDSDHGPSDEEHPMLNRTIVEGGSATAMRKEGKI